MGASSSWRPIGCLVLAAAIATLGMLTSGETPLAGADGRDDDPIAGYFADSLPRYPGVAEYPLGTKMRVGGEDMKLAYFITRDPPIRVAEFYARYWEAHGLRVTKDVTPHGGSVGAFDPENGAMAVSLVVRGGRTFAFPSLMQRPMRMLEVGDLADGGQIAAFPGSDGALRFTAEDEGRQSEVLSYGNWAGLRDNVDFYRREMGRRGWRESRDRSRAGAAPEVEGQRTLRFERRGERADISIAALGGGGRVRVLVTRTRGW
ncbi:MAG: hypothetical protein HYY06_16230 [Deltaproteobacteria bacterium]|nr:hypothetical protein [Deltaproteobacteria bacterium]